MGDTHNRQLEIHFKRIGPCGSHGGEKEGEEADGAFIWGVLRLGLTDYLTAGEEAHSRARDCAWI